MNYRAFRMKLKPGCIVEYKKRHDAIWVELEDQFKAQGIYKYVILIDEDTHTLFAYQEMKPISTIYPQDMGLMQKWWDYMADLMEVHPNNKPIVVPLKEMYCMKQIF
ncbi:L-rhamnose mutarotase [Arenibacter palladensis]|uniref:L-rhamnose mutarotase n=1 Tax=Arenibacter palladensis TaxID=237373 RepID=A0A1M5F1F5_9FLAO|nr:L-rhamnose mutarotase [Arenibacter palladensis]SHF85360.1 L-rhamnose mutarotase [Arenibacter palladensis]